MNWTQKQPPGCESLSQPDIFQTVTLTSAAFATCNLATLPDTSSAISLLGLGDGRLPSNLPVGRKIVKSGPEAAPASLSQSAGDRGGATDERHLWPEFLRLIRKCEPPVVFGEQVESPLGRNWLASVLTDLEGAGYAAAAAGLPAACVGAPQGRARLWWVANSNNEGRQGRVWEGQSHQTRQEWPATRCESLRSTGGPWPPRPSEVHTIPVLANGLPGAMGGCKGYGNAIVPQVAAEFIQAYLETTSGRHREPSGEQK